MSSLIHPVDPKTIPDTFGSLSEQRKKLGLGPHRAGIVTGKQIGRAHV